MESIIFIFTSLWVALRLSLVLVNVVLSGPGACLVPPVWSTVTCLLLGEEDEEDAREESMAAAVLIEVSNLTEVAATSHQAWSQTRNFAIFFQLRLMSFLIQKFMNFLKTFWGYK